MCFTNKNIADWIERYYRAAKGTYWNEELGTVDAAIAKMHEDIMAMSIEEASKIARELGMF